MVKELTPRCVLFSGGWESTALAIMAYREKAHLGWSPEFDLVFFDYGQPYARQENEAVNEIQRMLGDPPLIKVKLAPLPTTATGVWDDRNGVFIRYAADNLEYRDIWYGARGPLARWDPHGDSNWQYARRLARRLGVRVRTPLICWPKRVVQWYVRTNSYGIDEKVWSSEGWNYAADPPNEGERA